MVDHGQKAEELFLSGCNCAQATAAAFGDLTGLSEDFARKMACSFGGGVGRMREICGALSGILMVAGLLYGYTDPGQQDENKREHYQRVQELAGRFREETGAILCRELLNDPPTDPNPTPRTAEFYQTRPCARIIVAAARVLDEYIAAQEKVRLGA